MKGRPPKLSRAEITDIQDLYRTSKQNITSLARLFRVSTMTIARAIDGKLRAYDDPPQQKEHD